MKMTNHINSNDVFRQAVLQALMEQFEIDPVPLKTFLLEILESTPQLNDKKIGWLKGKNTLVKLYDLMKNQKLITCESELFINHFEGTVQPQAKIIWQANLNELVYLFDRLRDEGIIPLCKNPHILLQNKFLDKYENTLNAGSLRALLEKGIRNESRVEVIDKIINIILKS